MKKYISIILIIISQININIIIRYKLNINNNYIIIIKYFNIKSIN